MLTNGEHTSLEMPVRDTLPPSMQQGHALARFNGRYWMIGGMEGIWELTAAIRSSHDGIHWQLETESPGFFSRHRHQLVVHRGLLWLLGGEVFDGRNWRRAFHSSIKMR